MIQTKYAVAVLLGTVSSQVLFEGKDNEPEFLKDMVDLSPVFDEKVENDPLAWRN